MRKILPTAKKHLMVIRNITVFIFARAGSKGVPNKNIRQFCGKPLIQWTIELAKSINSVARIVVSTDSKKIASIAKDCGAEVPFLRPDHLASDKSPEWLSWRHALDYFVGAGEQLPRGMLVLPVTSPLRDVIDVTRCIELYEQGDVDAVITVSRSRRNPHFNMVYKDNNQFVKLVMPHHREINRRQDAPEVWDIATVAYLLDPTFVLSNNSLLLVMLKLSRCPMRELLILTQCWISKSLIF